MPEVDAAEVLRAVVGTSLIGVPGIYRRREDGSVEYRGSRRSAEWEGHGYFSVSLWMLINGRPERTLVWKHRWRLKGTHTTYHSRPPEDLSVGSCSLLVVLSLWSWLGSGKGLSNRRAVLPELEGFDSDRTVQRWFHRALRRALDVQQAIRDAVIHKCEPRPVETLFPGGLSPPEELLRRRWKDPPTVSTLWRALAILFYSATELDTPVTILLAEARRRWDAPHRPFPI